MSHRTDFGWRARRDRAQTFCSLCAQQLQRSASLVDLRPGRLERRVSHEQVEVRVQHDTSRLVFAHFAESVLHGRQGSPPVDVGLALAVGGARDEPRVLGRDERTFLTLRREQIEQEPDLFVDAPIRADKSSFGAALQAHGGTLIAR